MTPAPAQTVSEALRWRYATKKFDRDRKIPAATWACLEEALVLAPSSFGLQPWRFVVAQDPAMKERLSAAAHGQTQPVECSHFVVFAARRGMDASDVARHLARISEVRGAPVASLKGFGDVMAGFVESSRRQGGLDAWCARQTYIALGQFMAAAALLGVDACPMEGIDPAAYDQILGLSAQGYGSLCACAAGYRAQDDKYASAPKVRFRAQDVIQRA
jgi:nitroreductase